MKPFIAFGSSRIDSVSFLYNFHTTVDVLRLDLIHPVISGNKWFKLKEYLRDAKRQEKKVLATFGGAYSNHIVATAAAAQGQGLKSLGIIRGEKPKVLSHTLAQALSYGMDLIFVSREEYRKKNLPDGIRKGFRPEEVYLINEGGYGCKGMEGSKDILRIGTASTYTHIIAAAGTGTTLAGLTAASNPHQAVIGISVLKNNRSLQKDINNLVPAEKQNQFQLVHAYHFGGYAKHTPQLLQFMNDWYAHTGIPSDFVYTGKMFFAANELLHNSRIPEGSRVLIVHSGGLQGNLSLPKGTLIF